MRTDFNAIIVNNKEVGLSFGLQKQRTVGISGEMRCVVWEIMMQIFLGLEEGSKEGYEILLDFARDESCQVGNRLSVF